MSEIVVVSLNRFVEIYSPDNYDDWKSGDIDDALKDKLKKLYKGFKKQCHKCNRNVGVRRYPEAFVCDEHRMKQMLDKLGNVVLEAQSQARERQYKKAYNTLRKHIHRMQKFPNPDESDDEKKERVQGWVAEKIANFGEWVPPSDSDDGDDESEESNGNDPSDEDIKDLNDESSGPEPPPDGMGDDVLVGPEHHHLYEEKEDEEISDNERDLAPFPYDPEYVPGSEDNVANSQGNETVVNEVGTIASQGSVEEPPDDNPRPRSRRRIAFDEENDE